ncbi:transposable element Tcb2 transposase [Trichonephila clavipes]|nr:transposable element Tcb2 transposase [Trichonephila clavipes]
MMSFTRKSCSGRPRQTSCRGYCHVVRNACVQPTASTAAIQAQVAPSLVPVPSRIIRRLLAEGHLGSRHPLCVPPLTPNHRCLRLEWCALEETGLQRDGIRSSLVTKSRFNLSSDDKCVRVGRSRGERLNPAFALQRHTTSAAGAMVWDAISYNT